MVDLEYVRGRLAYGCLVVAYTSRANGAALLRLHHFLQLAALVKIQDDIAPTDQLTINEYLWKRWPLTVGGKVLPDFRLLEHIDMNKLGASGV